MPRKNNKNKVADNGVDTNIENEFHKKYILL